MKEVYGLGLVLIGPIDMVSGPLRLAVSLDVGAGKQFRGEYR